MTGEVIEMSLDMASLPELMSIMTNLYSDKELAVIREYSSNAIDAHVDAGFSGPIEVTTPTSLSNYFKVRDFGDGLNADDIRNIIAKYGRSTKRDNNDTIGRLGLGCKSALTYTHQFMMTGIKNGIETIASISMDEDNCPKIRIVSETPTDIASGVEIIVPAKAGNTFERKAKLFFSFWKEGTVVVNGNPPDKMNGEWIEDGRLFITNDLDKSYLVMGNVAYPCPEFHSGYSRRHWVAYVNIGDVNITPSREALQYDAQTKRAVENLRVEMHEKLQASLQAKIDAEPDHISAYKKYNEVRQLGYDTKNATYRGVAIPHKWSWPPTVIKVPYTNFDGTQTTRDENFYTEFTLVRAAKWRGNKGWSKERVISADSNYIWLTGFTHNSFTPYRRRKLDQFFSKKSISLPDYYILVDTLPPDSDPWIPKNRIFNWADVEAEKIVNNSKRGDGRPTGSYSGFLPGDSYGTHDIQAGKIDQNKPLFYEVGSAHRYGMSRPNGFDRIRAVHSDSTIIVLGQNRVNKFKRDFPNAQRVSDWLKTAAVNWVNSLTHEQKIGILFMDGTFDRSGIIRRLDDTKVNDPDLVNAIKIAKSRDFSKQYNEYDKWSRFGAKLEVKWNDPSTRYPLLTNIAYFASLSQEAKDHIYIYLNAVYAANNNKQKEA